MVAVPCSCFTSKRETMNFDSGDNDFYIYNANHRFAAMYPLLARQIIDDYGMDKGTVLDVGTGGAPLPIELAGISDLDLIGLDMKAEALAIARQNIARRHMPRDRITLIQGDVRSIPLPDDSVDLIISRGSIPFWEDMAASFADVNRVLASGGTTFIGCGFSRYQPIEEVRKMRPAWSKKGSKDYRNAWKQKGRIPKALKEAGVERFRILGDEYGLWVEITKPIPSSCNIKKPNLIGTV